MGGQPPPAASTTGKDSVPILQEAGWAPGPVWTGGKSRPHRYSIPDRPACSQSLYRLSYPAHAHTHRHTHTHIYIYIYIYIFFEWHYILLNSGILPSLWLVKSVLIVKRCWFRASAFALENKEEKYSTESVIYRVALRRMQPELRG